MQDTERQIGEKKKYGHREYFFLHHGKEQMLLGEEISCLLQENRIEAACIGGEYREELSFEELLLDERYADRGIIVEKSLLRAAGGKNIRLGAKWEYELILRVCGLSKVALLPENWMESSKKSDIEAASPWESFCTDAYIAGRYSDFLREKGLFSIVIEALWEEGISCGKSKEAQEMLGEMISRTNKYYHYYEATQPILIYLSADFCYNMLNTFARELARALERQGQRVEFYDVQKEDVQGLSRLAGKHYKASIGFQMFLFAVKRKDKESYFQDMIGGPKYNFILDHPIWMKDQLSNVPKRYYVLTHDRDYQSFIQTYYKGVAGTYLLPPGGRMAEETKVGRCYDITFLGTYGNYRKKLQAIAACAKEVKFLAARYLLYMTKDTDLTAERAFAKALEHYGIPLEKEAFFSLFRKMQAVIQCVMYYYREKIIGTLIKDGLTVHVYGDSWKESPFAGEECLKIHREVASDRSMEVLRASRISLNVMSWHKDGFTERIADSMLAGAVVVSDKSRQLEEYYSEETVLFHLQHLQELPCKIRELLDFPEKREKIAAKAREKAIKCASWDVRAKELLALIEENTQNEQNEKEKAADTGRFPG